MRELYHYPLCAFGRQIRVYMREKSLDVDLIVEFPWERHKKFSDLHFISDLPTLVEIDNNVFEGWYAILEYVEQAYRTNSLLGVTLKEKAETRRVVALFNEMFYSDVTKNIVFEKVWKRYIEHMSPDSSAVRKGNVAMKKYFEYITWLADRRNWLAGNEFSFADIVAASHISCLDYLGSVDWNSFEELKEWYVRVKSRPSFREILSDRIANVTPPECYSQLDF